MTAPGRPTVTLSANTFDQLINLAATSILHDTHYGKVGSTAVEHHFPGCEPCVVLRTAHTEARALGDKPASPW